MEHYEVEIGPEAKKQLSEYYNYILHKFQSKKAAKSTIQRIKTAISSLEYFPFRCPKRDINIGNNKEEHQLIVKKYKIFYQIDTQKSKVLVNSIFLNIQNYDA